MLTGMLINIQTKPCLMCGKVSNVEVDAADYRRWKEGQPIQLVWPNKTLDERELLITGTHPECWDKMEAEWEAMDE